MALSPAKAQLLRTLGGLLLGTLWVAAAVVIISLSLMGTLMANDAGAAPASAQTRMVVLVLTGQILAASAGLPLGLACFWRGRARLLLVAFALLFGAGSLLAAAGVWTFVSAMPA